MNSNFRIIQFGSKFSNKRTKPNFKYANMTGLYVQSSGFQLYVFFVPKRPPLKIKEFIYLCVPSCTHKHTYRYTVPSL